MMQLLEYRLWSAGLEVGCLLVGFEIGCPLVELDDLLFSYILFSI